MRTKTKKGEPTAENLFRKAYGVTTFIEKSAISSIYGFKSKKGTAYAGYPDFFREDIDYCIVVEAKADDHSAAEDEVKYYMGTNKIRKDIIGMAVSGQKKSELRVSYYLRLFKEKKFITIPEKDAFVKLAELHDIYLREKYGDIVSDEDMIASLKAISKLLSDSKKVSDTEKSLFFSGIMIALCDKNFRSTYDSIQAPTLTAGKPKNRVLEACNLNDSMLKAINDQLADKVNNLSKEYSWKDKFSFIKNIDFALDEYKDLIRKIEYEIFYPFQYGKKQDILGHAYKIFLLTAGSVDNKNIILTPDHIKSLMVKLARVDENDVVMDTCMGTGGFLMEAMEQMLKLAAGKVSKVKSITEKQLIGFEVDPVLYSLACSNMFLHGDGRTNLIFRSSLLGESQNGILNGSDKDILRFIKKAKPTRIIINPPYESNSAIKFVLQAIEYLEKDGELVVLMPTPTLTRNQNGLTEKLLEVAKLKYVIRMPEKLFSEQKRTVNTSIFGFTKAKHNKSDEVLFYDLSDDGFESIQHKGRIDVNKTWPSIEKEVLDIILNSKTKKDVCVKKKIYSGNTLNCAGVQVKKTKGHKMVMISDLFDVADGSLQSSKNTPGAYPFITGADEWKTNDQYSHDAEAIVFVNAAAGSLGKTHYVNGKFIASDLCLILTAKKKSKYPIDMQFYNYYFMAIRNQLVSDLKDGVSKLTIDRENLKRYYIEYVPLTDQQNFINTTVSAFNKEKAKFQKLNEAFEKAVNSLA